MSDTATTDATTTATAKPIAGGAFASITLPLLGGGERDLGQPAEGRDWTMVVVYRGQHCPLCTRYLKGLTTLVEAFHAEGIDVVAVSADSAEQAKSQMAEVEPTFPVAHSLSTGQMRQLGLYISDPRSAQETDHAFAEPALFVVNGGGDIQIVDISNAPFARPDLEALLGGLQFVRANSYPIRGTHAA